MKYTYANLLRVGGLRVILKTTMSKLRKTLERWTDDTKMAFVGVQMVMRQPVYVLIAIAGFLVFSYIFAMFQNGTATWSLLWSSISLGDKMGLLLDVADRILQNFLDLWGLVLILLAALQGLTVSLLIFSWRMKMSAKSTVAGLEAGGVGAAMGFLALGCPTCGTSLFIPFLTMSLGSGAAVVAETLGWILTTLAAILLLYAARRLGYSAFVEITARRHKNGKS